MRLADFHSFDSVDNPNGLGNNIVIIIIFFFIQLSFVKTKYRCGCWHCDWSSGRCPLNRASSMVQVSAEEIF